jgi:protease secretion system membrane fusion protein
MKAIVNKAAVSDVISHDVSPLVVNTDERVYSKLGWIIVLLGVGGFLLWAMFAPLDKGAPLSGTVAKESNRKTIQHPTGGVVEEILVKEGDVVKAGQVLLKMNPIQVTSAANISRIQLWTAQAIEARLLAERDGKSSIQFPASLTEAKGNTQVVDSMNAQSQLFTSRHISLQSEIGAIDESVAGLKMQVTGLEESLTSKKQQLGMVKEQLDNMRDLAKEGYVARSRLLDMERTYAQIGGAISEDIGNIGRSRRQIAELGLRRVQRAQDAQKEVRGQLAEVQREVNSLVSRLDSQNFDLANAEIKAPVDGIIVAVNVFTRGGVIPPGFRIMEMLPANDDLVIEGQLPVNLVDKVHPNLPVELIFSAFNTNKTPHLPGIITQVSADRFTDERSGMPYYKIKARVTKEGMKIIASHKLEVRAGMPVDLFVKTGERTMMSYLLKPVMDRAKTSMTEE